MLPRRAVAPAALAGSLGALGLAIAVVAGFDSGASGLQYYVSESWIPGLGVRYQLGVDGLSVFLVLLTALLWAASTAFAAFRQPEGRERVYFFMLALGETAALGAFLAQDLLLFVLFFDLMLIPFWFLIGAFGGENRIAATTKMIVYTLVGSLLMLVAAIATAILASGAVGHISFSLADLRAHTLGTSSQYWIFCFFAAAFLVKMPAFLVHGWLPDAYRAAPLPVLALLSGVLSKVGAYGFLRIVLPLYPQATTHFQELLLVIGVAGILYGSVMAFTQTNVRLIAGYSSIAQLGFITLGIFSLRADGADGSVLQMVNHGLVVAGVFQSKIVYALVAAIGVGLAAYYAIRLFQRTMHNRLPEGIESREISLRDAAALVPVAACIVGLALYPGLITSRADTSVKSSVSAATASPRPAVRGPQVSTRTWSVASCGQRTADCRRAGRS